MEARGWIREFAKHYSIQGLAGHPVNPVNTQATHGSFSCGAVVDLR